MSRLKENPEEVEMVDRIVDTLERAIHSGELVPGKRISEQALAGTLGVSRTLLREALRKLEARRLIERRAHSGIRLVDLSIMDIEQLLIVREALEGAAARMAAEKASAEDIQKLRTFLADESQRGEMIDFAPQQASGGIHHLIAVASKNPWLQKILCDDLYGLLRAFRYVSIGSAERNVEMREEHGRIVDAIEARDPDAAERLMRLHNISGRNRLVAQLKAEAQKAEEESPFLKPIARERKQPTIRRSSVAKRSSGA